MPSRFENTQRGERASRVSSEIRARAYFAVLLSIVNGDHTQSIHGLVTSGFHYKSALHKAKNNFI